MQFHPSYYYDDNDDYFWLEIAARFLTYEEEEKENVEKEEGKLTINYLREHSYEVKRLQVSKEQAWRNFTLKAATSHY